ncbi:MAG: cytochrome c [Mesorhizobium sp.]|uniref:c-type cytochrome n=1 Tax=Mesorhizobium sp. TaxID=1871066 RepID=UPI0011F750A2|nr:cytochrome c [Mesorhizobium sp.]TIP22507.1 MAG: cytochrome c [Mesorhizobium sp.]
MKILIAAVFAGLGFNAAGAQEVGNGKAEYMNSCAVCHGPQGKGDGSLADEMLKRPADLTHLSKQNGGEFPYWRVFAVIDGLYVVPEHGERDMPVWGRQFLPGDAKKYGPNAGEIVTRERIHELAGYVQTLQR